MPRTLVLLAAVLFGTTGTAQALGPEGSPLEGEAARVAVGAALLALVAWGVEAWRHTSAPSRRWPLPALAGAALGVAGYQLAFFAAVDDTGVAVGTVVALGSAPAMAGLLGRLAGGPRL